MYRNLITTLAELSRKQWTRVTLEMAWYYRKGAQTIPPITGKYSRHLPPTREDWEYVRGRVNKLRKEHKDKAAVAVKQVRRDYMRSYMVSYRRKLKDRPQAGG